MSFTAPDLGSHRPVRTPPPLPSRVDAVHDEMTARREAMAIAGASQPLARVAALLVSISRNNSYEGRDPNVIPDALNSGFVADLLGVDVATLAAQLVDLRHRGLVELTPDCNLRLRDLDSLEALAD